MKLSNKTLVPNMNTYLNLVKYGVLDVINVLE